jgi:hypothetical protein
MDDAYEGVILLDIADGEEARFDEDMLRRFGHPVIVCHGPDPGHGCPLLTGEGCQKFEDAHGIGFQLDLDRSQHRAILLRYRELTRPDVPIRVLVSEDQAARYAELLEPFEVWTHEPNVADLDGFASEVEAADRLAD